MLTGVQWIYLVIILLCALAGGYMPLARPRVAEGAIGYPKSEAFASGVFLALSLMMMLPSAFAVFRRVVPGADFPIASVIAILAFIILLAIEHLGAHLLHARQTATESPVQEETPTAIPVIMTLMIAAPSFFLGTALGVSDAAAAALIFVAVVLHKATAAFALALTMVRSSLTRRQTFVLFSLFAIATPLGILTGAWVRGIDAPLAMTVKGVVLSLGAGTFLYMGTLHEMKRATLIEHCCKPSCFIAMLMGLGVTTVVRWVVGEAHRF